MKNCLANVETLIDRNVELCARLQLTKEEFEQGLLSLLLTSMRANNDGEHNLCDQDGELLLHVKRYK
ncbi:hypothetical protein [Escherichia phage CLB_P3]|nr:hypothetical protein [Escherichia phage CLB_P3]